ncbi:MAG: hypothetical protein HZB51_15390 [Chloroflexi bacterium]|nr:hypothetical protein [Chloroflexota bacterium]
MHHLPCRLRSILNFLFLGFALAIVMLFGSPLYASSVTKPIAMTGSAEAHAAPGISDTKDVGNRGQEKRSTTVAVPYWSNSEDLTVWSLDVDPKVNVAAAWLLLQTVPTGTSWGEAGQEQ